MVRAALCLWAIVILSFAEGCAVTAPYNELGPAFDHEELSQMLGSTTEDVRSRIGPPAHDFEGPSKSYFVYEAQAWHSGVVFLPIPAPCPSDCLRSVACSMLEFDANKGLIRFERDTVRISPVFSAAVPPDCLKVFWSEKEIAELLQVQRAVIEQRAREGDPEAMYEIALRIDAYRKSGASEIPGEFTMVRISYDDLGWYCRAAHHGHALARFQVARSHHRGLLEFEDDYERAYLWYSLSLSAGYEAAEFYRKDLSENMTAGEVVAAERLLVSWQPDPASCEVYFEKND